MHSSGPRNSRRWLISLLVLLVIIGLCWWFWPATAPHKGAEAAKPAASAGRHGMSRPGFGNSTEAVPVRVAVATQADFPIYYKALGTVTATNTINVRSRVAGELVKINFREGQMVKAGDLLAEIDPRTYQIDLQQAEGTLATNQALLRNAELDVQRYRDLYREDSIAKQTLDTAESLVNQYKGTVKSNQAAVNEARLNLEFTKIRAPIAGRVGLKQLDLGNLVAANDTTALVVITQTQPIAVSFTLPEPNVPAVIERYRQGEKLPVEAWDRGDVKQQATGVLASADNQIDVATGTLKFKARFDNRDEALIPNQFVNVRLLADTLKQAVLVPTPAVQYGTNGTFVYSVDADKKARISLLKTGPSNEQYTVVTEGLSAGAQVVMEGTDRLRDGTPVDIVSDSKDVPSTPGQKLQGKPDKAEDNSASASAADNSQA